METTFSKILPHIWQTEGGYINHRRDPGGATNLGITHRTLARWRKVRRVSRAQVKALKKPEAARIYKAWYWDAVKADDLPAGVDYSVFDFGVNSGPRRSIKTLQRAVGSYADGKIGPVTLAATFKNPETTIQQFAKQRTRFYRRLRSFRTFGRGWLRRVKRVLKTSLQLLRSYTSSRNVEDTSEYDSEWPSWQ